jgi:hypothetical protein
MKRNGRARNGVEAKRRRARIARRLAYAIPMARDRAVASDYLARLFPGARIVWRGYDRFAHRFAVAVFHPSPYRWTEPMKLTVGFAAPNKVEAEPRPAPAFRAYLDDAIDYAMGASEIPAELLRPPPPATPVRVCASEIIRLINEGKVRVEPPLPDPFDQGEDT